MSHPTPSAARRLNSRLNLTERGCLEYQGSCVSTQYGQIRVAGRLMYTHRLAWELAHGTIPDGMCVCHRCDNPPCCNPDHLFLGTHRENVADCVAKGRQARGGIAGTFRKSPLTDEDVREIRRRYAAGGITQAQLSREYGVRPGTVSAVITRRRWGHID